MAFLKNRFVQLVLALLLGYGGGQVYTLADLLKLAASYLV